ncbi:MAG: hypothetical protein ACFHX7_12350 [Pseudomonadota bacterium]
MVFVNKAWLTTGLLLGLGAVAEFDNSVEWNGSVYVSARGQLNGNDYTFSLQIDDDTMPTLDVGDKLTATSRGPSEFTPVSWWQNGRQDKGESCSGPFWSRKCKRTYHNHKNIKNEQYRVSDVRFGLRPLRNNAACSDVLKVAPGDELVVSFPSRLCMVTEGRFTKPGTVAGPGSPDGPVRVLRQIDSNGKRVLVFGIKIVREQPR